MYWKGFNKMLNKELLQEMLDKKYVMFQKHDTEDLYIYNYTQSTQYESVWNEITLACRGLILDKELNIIQKPFGKFFNLEQLKASDIPKEPFDVYEKMDGSLLVMYFIDNKPFLASRGSFNSEQACMGNTILYTKYKHLFPLLDRSATYVFELIFPSNRIVVDYGDTEDIVLLSIIDVETGEERLDDIGFTIVKKHDGIQDINTLKSLEEPNREGFVIRYKSGLRVKVKFEEYCRLHRIITDVSSTNIWEYLSQNKDFEEILDRVPDEFYNWVKKTKQNIRLRYKEIYDLNLDIIKNMPKFESRKEIAEFCVKQKYTGILFSMLDNNMTGNYKSVDSQIWRLVKPKFEKPFNMSKE